MVSQGRIAAAANIDPSYSPGGDNVQLHLKPNTLGPLEYTHHSIGSSVLAGLAIVCDIGGKLVCRVASFCDLRPEVSLTSLLSF